MKYLVLMWPLCKPLIYRSMTRAWSVGVFGRGLHVENKHRTCVFLLFTKCRYFSTSNTKQNMYGKNKLYLCQLIGSMCMYKDHLQKYSFSNPWLAQSVASLLMNPKFVGSRTTVGKNFSFLSFRFSRAPRSLAEHIPMKSSISFIRSNRCIETMII